MAEIRLNKNNFEEVVAGSDKPVLVDFWASWCGACAMLAPVIEETADEYAGKITVGKVNVDEEPELAAQFGVSSIPTVIIFKNGKAQKSSVGFRPIGDFKKMIDELL